MGDSAVVRRISTDTAGLAWAQRWTRSYPDFFKRISETLAVRDLSRCENSADRLAVIAEVSFVSCPPPAHVGANDRYLAVFRRVSGSWLIEKGFRPAC